MTLVTSPQHPRWIGSHPVASSGLRAPALMGRISVTLVEYLERLLCMVWLFDDSGTIHCQVHSSNNCWLVK